MINRSRLSMSVANAAVIRPSPATLRIPIDFPPPESFGLPSTFPAWRAAQLDAINRIIDSDKRFIVICAPTGIGKSLIAMASALMSSRRTVTLTSTLGLADQYSQMFSDISTDVRGMHNYRCHAAPSLGLSANTTVSDAPCHMGYRCPMRFGGCDYFDAYRRARDASLITTTYQCWMYDSLKDPRESIHNSIVIEPFQNAVVDMLVCDECFPAGTRIGTVPIQDIRAGDSVDSFDGINLVHRKVTRLYRKRPQALCRVNFADGSSVVCTPNHPFLTLSGWASHESGNLINSFVVQYPDADAKKTLSPTNELRQLRNAIHGQSSNDKGRLQAQKGFLLQSAMRGQVASQESCENRYEMPLVPKTVYDQRNQGCLPSSTQRYKFLQPILCYEAEIPRSSAQAISSCDTEDEPTPKEEFPKSLLSEKISQVFNWAEKWPESTRWKWTTCSSTTAKTGRSVVLENRSGCQNVYQTRDGHTHPLQNRCCKSFGENSNRSRWPQSQLGQAKEARPKKKQIPSFKRVDSVEVLQPTSDGTFGGLCPDGFVYNLEVEGTHTYIAENCVVHNCTEAVEEIQRFISISLSRRECSQLHLDWPDYDSLARWREWSGVRLRDIRQRIARHEDNLKNGNGNSNGDGWLRELKLLRDISRKLDRLSTIAAADQWVMSSREDPETHSVDSVEFVPLEPARFAELALWRQVKKVVLLSATIRPKTAAMLGIPADQMTFIEYPSTFPVSRRPIIVVPTVMLSHRSEQDDALMTRWLHRIDSIIAGRLDRKGIIHVVSYSRGRFLFDNSAYRSHMLIHNSHNRAEIINDFIQSSAPRILVSPSLSTGYDFYGDRARYAIIAKLPFQTVTDPVVKARQALDPDYGTYLTAQEIVQSSGRIVRSESDFGQTFICDDSFGNWFYRRAYKFFPAWWLEAIVWSDGVPGGDYLR